MIIRELKLLNTIAALSLFTAVGHWNACFDGIIRMSDPQSYPMQSYL